MSEPQNQRVPRDWDLESARRIITISALLPVALLQYQSRIPQAGVVEFNRTAQYFSSRHSDAVMTWRAGWRVTSSGCQAWATRTERWDGEFHPLGTMVVSHTAPLG